MSLDFKDPNIKKRMLEGKFCLEKDNQFLFSTSPLSQEAWHPVTFMTLLAYQNGKRVLIGTNHGNEYKDSEENMKFLYSIFSNL